jgi:hypothetical protein
MSQEGRKEGLSGRFQIKAPFIPHSSAIRFFLPTSCLTVCWLPGMQRSKMQSSSNVSILEPLLDLAV